MNIGITFMDDLCKSLSLLIDDKKKKKEDDAQKLQVKKNDRDGHYLYITKIRCNLLKQQIEKLKEIDVNGYKLDPSKLVFKDLPTGTGTKIFFPDLEKKSDEMDVIKNKIIILTKKYFQEVLNTLYEKYSSLFIEMNRFVSYIDFIKSNAKTACLYNYCKPVIVDDKEKGFIDAKQLRHPVIERLIDYEYVPHDVSIGKDLKGMLIYGLNSSGKCFHPDTKIMMFDNTIKRVQNICVGDKLMGDDSTPRVVLNTTTGFNTMYKIITDKSEDEFIVNAYHILCLINIHTKDIIEISVEDYLKTSNDFKLNYKLYKTHINYPEFKTDFNPYYVASLLLTHIPNEYKYNSFRNRLLLLKGIIESNIILCESKSVKLRLINTVLNNDVIWLARSLGFSAYQESYYIRLYGDLSLIKSNKLIGVEDIEDNLEISFNIRNIGKGKYCGFEVDGNKRFLLDNFIVTHNSSIMKAMGCDIVMAQAGLYVPAKEFKYSPYTTLYTRITGNDNIFKGLSSFALEMVELKAILRRANSKSLIIGDEICRGTEHVSGSAIVASAIINLSKASASFILATHLHEISTMERITKLDNVKSFHLSVEHDKKTDSLIFDRKLRDGSGEPIYGVTVAKYIINDADFIETANEIKNEILKTHGTLIPDKKSKYNA